MRSPSAGLLLLLAAIAIVAVVAQETSRPPPPTPRPCPINTYQNSLPTLPTDVERSGGNGNNHCTPCPPNSGSPAGSDALTDCVCLPNFSGPPGGLCVPPPPVNGGWCNATACTTTCGDGGVRTRTCACPAPANGGAACEGPSEEACTGLPACVPNVNGGWCNGTCSATCGEGTLTRTCTCPPPQGTGANCEGPSTLSCSSPACNVPVNGGWCNATACTTTCGTGGVRSRVCACPAPAFGGAACEGPSEEACTGLPECVPDVTGGWCPFTNCSATCGGGTQTRTCTCPPPQGVGATCVGESTQACNLQSCTVPLDGGWCPFSNCSTTCGDGGVRSRTCACPAPANGGAACVGASEEACTGLPACVPDVTGGWCPFSNCSATCGGGTQTRTCTCPPPQGVGATCVGESTQACNTNACSVQLPCPCGTYSPTGTYLPGTSTCTACPEFSSSREGSDSITDCKCWFGYEKQEDGSCAPIDHTDGGWCPFSECSASCGCGVRTRTCGCPARSGRGKDCKGPSQVECVQEACVGTEVCPPSTYSPTGSYIPGTSTCTACPAFTFSPAGSTNVANCTCWPGFEGPAGGPCTEIIPSVNGGWCPYTDCSATCGGGTQTRVCECPPPQGTGATCKGRSVRQCAECACETEGVLCPASTYSATGKYIPGSTECTPCPLNSEGPVGSTSLNNCLCQSGYAGPAGGPCTEIVPSVNGGWCPLSACDAECDGGFQTRTCACPPREGDGADCEGASQVACNTESCVQECPESHYSSTGTWDCRTEHRCRKCPKYSWSPAGSDSKRDCECWAGYEGPRGGPCTPVVEVSVNGGWCPATECSATCGGGTQTRVCECPPPQGSGATCSGEATVECNSCPCSEVPDGALPCPESTYSADGMYIPGQTECTACPESSWSPSGSDAITDCGCWDGFTGPDGGPCTEVVPSVNGGWCPFDSCSVACGGGTQTRSCACPPPEGTGAQCEGSAEAACNTEECPFPQPANTTCSDATDAEQCSGWEGCVVLSGYDCTTRDWCAYLGCAESAVAAQVQTCAVNTETGDRAWFPTSQLPAGYLETTPMGSVRSCCAPRECNSTTAARDDDGCTYRVGDACAVLQFRGEVPADLTAQQAWLTSFFNEMAAAAAGLLRGLGVDIGNVQLSDYVTVVSGPNPNNATGTYSTTIQIKPLDYSVTLPVSPEQLVSTIVAALQSGDVAATQVVSQLQGVAAFTQFTADGPVEPTPRATASAADGLQSSIVLVLATGVVATIVAKVAAFMQ